MPAAMQDASQAMGTSNFNPLSIFSQALARVHSYICTGYSSVHYSTVTVFDEKSTTNRYYLLDLLRFLACLMVVFWHYVHFFYVGPGVLPLGWEPSSQPLFPIFFLGYKFGHLGVQMFWALSGFVFFALFSGKIHRGELSARNFAVDRFSRLYPLHLFSLLLVLLLTGVLRHLTGNEGIYPCNDLYHFILNVFFVPYVLPNSGWSFNAPVWSVSLELIAYVFFFMFARFLKPTLFKVGCIVLICAWLQPWPSDLPCGGKINGCLFFFFSGGAVFLLLRTCSQYFEVRFVYVLLVAVFIAVGIWKQRSSVWIMSFLLLFSFPFHVPGRLETICSHLGNLTYAIYMLHVPIQLGLMIVVRGIGTTTMADMARLPCFLGFYLFLLGGVSFGVYRCFELPTKKQLRARLSR